MGYEFSNNHALEAEFVAKAINILGTTKFSEDGWRTTRHLSADGWRSNDEAFEGSLYKRSRDEFDFSDLPECLFKFAEIWEYSRELSECYEGRFKKGNLPRINPILPLDAHFQLLWAWNERFFPLPIMTLIRARVFKMEEASGASSIFNRNLAVRELDPTIFGCLAFKSELRAVKFKGHDGNQKTVNLMGSLGENDALEFLKQFPIDRWKEIIGIGPQEFWNASNLPKPDEAAHISFHAIAIDWERGKDAIKSELEEWVDKLRANYSEASDSKAVSKGTNRGRKPTDPTTTSLSQLAAWRALQVGYTAHNYLLLRAVWAKILESPAPPHGDPDLKKLARRFKRVTHWPSYPRQGDFKNMGEKSGTYLASLKSQIASETSNLG